MNAHLKAPIAALLLAATGFLAPACLQPVRRELPPILEPSPGPARLSQVVVTLRLSRFEGASSLALTDAASKEFVFRTEGSMIRSSTGALRSEFIERSSARALSIDGSLYRGTLRIFLRPEGGL